MDMIDKALAYYRRESQEIDAHGSQEAQERRWVEGLLDAALKFDGDDWTEYDAHLDTLGEEELREALKTEAAVRRYYQEHYQEMIDQEALDEGGSP